MKKSERNNLRSAQNLSSPKNATRKQTASSKTSGATKSVPALNVPLTLHLVEAVASQAALANENARLYNAASLRGDREHLVSEITTQIRNTTDPETMLQTALDELKRVLGTDNIRIRPYSPPSPERNSRPNSRQKKNKSS